MKKLTKYLFALSMTVGISFLTTDIDNYILQVDNNVIAQISDNEPTDNPSGVGFCHHPTEDLFAPNNTNFCISESILMGAIGFIPPMCENRFHAPIWQPPKFL